MLTLSDLSFSKRTRLVWIRTGGATHLTDAWRISEFLGEQQLQAPDFKTESDIDLECPQETQTGLHQQTKAQRFWAVAIGHQTGVYNSPEEAESAVRGFSGARRKKFTSYQQTVQWIDRVHYEQESANRQAEYDRLGGVQLGEHTDSEIDQV